MRKIFTLGLCFLLPALWATAQQRSASVIRLPQREAALEHNTLELSQVIASSTTGNNLAQIYLSFQGAPNKAALKAAGITLEGNLLSNVYLAIIRTKPSPAQLQQLGINGWANVKASDKLNPMLLEAGNNTEAEQHLLVSVMKGMSREAVAAQLTAFGAKLPPAQSWKDQDLWQVDIAGNKIEALAASSFVRFINPEFTPQTLNNQAIGFTNAQGAHQPLSIGGHNLHGEGVTVGIGDDSDPNHIDYIDRVRSFNPILASTHAFHTTGTMAGNGIKDERYKGFAPAAQIVTDFFSQVIANGATYYQDFDMVTSNNSYGNILGVCSYAGTYDIYTQYCDQQMRDIPELLTIFAAGNDGKKTCSPYPTGYATVAGSYQTAKNVLTVGDIGKPPSIDHFTSARGPVKDGRLKPEITAIGAWVISSIDNNNYDINSGTSIACPNVTGASALLYQRYRQLHSGQNPHGALVKTLLMNGAIDLDIPGPDFRYGFGLMNVGHSLKMMDNNQYFTDSINTTQEHTYTFTIPANTARAKVMLYWNDPASAPLTTHALINDLDLTVVTPASTTLLPMILDTLPSQVTTPAVAGVDRLNNVEQVTLDNPAAGTYTIKVKGFNVPEINQEYFVAYDLLPDGVTLHYPFGGESLSLSDSMIIFWEASASTNTFTLSYSTDNGGSWNVINNNINANARFYTWYPPGSIASNQCLIRIQRNSTSQQSQSQPFTLLGRPVITLNPIAEQCPGTIKISWNAVPGAASYRIFRKAGPEMVPVTTVSGTTYTFTGLSTDSTYWVSVAPVINGSLGMRAVALSRLPVDGGCTGITAHGDLRLNRIVAPGNGRQFTATTLSTATPLTVLINNLDDQTAANYSVSYKVNSGAWTSQGYTDPISPAGNRQITLGNLNLAAPGNYIITVAVTNQALADPLAANDTMTLTIKQIANPIMNLSGGYTEGFEATGDLAVIGRGITGIDGAEKWDFTQSQPKGQLRSYVNSAITIAGSKSASMDNAGNQRDNIPGSSYNTLTGTFNLSSYNTTNWEVRCEFDYIMHGIPKFDTGNRAWVRGSDSDPWLPLLQYQIDTLNLGAIYNSGTLSLTDILGNAGQTFSSSTQIRFTQYDTSRISATYFGNGLTMDNFKLYLVTDDVQLLAIDSVYHYNCGLSNSVPMRIRVRNGVNNTVHNIAVFYQLDGQPVVSGLIDSIPGKDTAEYTFSQPMNMAANTTYNLSSWIYVATDTYRLNDSIMNFKVKNQPVIATFPYLQNFETNDGYFYAEGSSSSWEYGTPNSSNIDHAASGSKAWKTKLQGHYNKLELSYLYSPCFDISGMSTPTLSFSLATDIEEAGSSIFDVAFVEYSHDGHTWQRLGQAGEGTNWYNNEQAQAWAKSGEDYWHVATIPLPKDGPIVSFRFVMRADQGTELDGIAVDDIHVYDLVHPIFDQAQFNTPVTQNVGVGQTVNFIQGNDIGVGLLNSTAALGNTAVQAYKHTQFINDDSTQYFIPKNFTVQTTNAPGDSVAVRFYIPDEAMRIAREDEACYSCSKVREVQQLGITKYDDPDKAIENNLLSDNRNGSYVFIPKGKITWIPYDIGYYAETKIKSFSEFWFNDGGPTKDQPIVANLFDFTASHYGPRHALLNWASYIDASTQKYELQRADAAMNFTTIATLNAVGQNGHSYSYIDTPMLTNGPEVFYRIRYTMQDGGQYLSLIRSLSWEGQDGQIRVYPNPVRNGVLNLEWFKGSGDGLQWSIYTVVGQQVIAGYTETNGYSGRHTFDLSRMALSPGLYVLRVVSGKDKWEFKIVYQ